jgi:hypothetical protein
MASPVIEEEPFDMLSSSEPIPDLSLITPEQALSYLNHSLSSLISLHESLPLAESAITEEPAEFATSPPCGPQVHIASPDTPVKSISHHAHNDHFEGDMSPFTMQKFPSPSHRLEERGSRSRRRSSFLLAEAAAVAKLVIQNDINSPHAQDVPTEVAEQKMIIARRFWSKTAPDISVWKYLQRLHRYCPTSTAVYLAAGVYVYRLCIVLQTIPLTALSVHRLILGALRVACKSLEDVNHTQKRYATAGGVSQTDLYRLEIALLFLLDFNIKVDADVLQHSLEIFAELDVQAKRQQQLSRKRTRSSPTF